MTRGYLMSSDQARAMAVHLWDAIGKIADPATLEEVALQAQTETLQLIATEALSTSPSPLPHVVEGDEDHMIQIADLISQLEAIQDRFGNTCVYIRRQGMGWGAVALNRRDDDKKNGVFDLQAQHDRDMQARLEQIERLKADRDEAWRLRRDAEGSRDAAYAAADSLRKERDHIRSLLKLAIEHIEHMAAFIGPKRLGYSFESLGEDMPGMKAALASAATTEGSADAD